MTCRQRPRHGQRGSIECPSAFPIAIRLEPIGGAGFEVAVRVTIETRDGPAAPFVSLLGLTETQRAAREQAQWEARAITPTGP